MILLKTINTSCTQAHGSNLLKKNQQVSKDHLKRHVTAL